MPGVDRSAVEAHLVVEVGASGTTAVAHQGYLLASLHPLSHLHQDLVKMAVDGGDAVAVADLHGETQPSVLPDAGHYPVSRGDDGGTYAV